MTYLKDLDKAGIGLGLVLTILMFIASVLTTSSVGFPAEAFSNYGGMPEIQAGGVVINFIFYYLAGYRAMDWIKENE